MSKMSFAENTPDIDYLATNLDLKNMKLTLKNGNLEEEYDLISDNIINIYNICHNNNSFKANWTRAKAN